MRAFSEAWRDEEEGPLLMAALDESEASMERYIAWLEARGDERAVLARGLRRLCEEPLDVAEREALRAQVWALCERADEQWLGLFAPFPRVFNCGGQQEQGAVRFAFRCPRRWETLAVTAQPGERWCEGCAERVYLCESVREAEARALKGECVAVRAALAGEVAREVTQLVLGRPDARMMWGERIFGR